LHEATHIVFENGDLQKAQKAREEGREVVSPKWLEE
jgi:hypothetical protein